MVALNKAEKTHKKWYLLDVLCDEAAGHLLVVGDEQEGLGLGRTLCLHLLEAQVVVYHLPDLLHLKQTHSMKSTPYISRMYHLLLSKALGSESRCMSLRQRWWVSGSSRSEMSIVKSLDIGAQPGAFWLEEKHPRH